MTRNYIARIINNNHTELKKLPKDNLINLGIDENNEVYIYNHPSDKFPEVNWKFSSIDEAKPYLTCVKPIVTEVKELSLKAALKNKDNNR